jgi:putative PIN family toxin of toxin-antitoxin system
VARVVLDPGVLVSGLIAPGGTTGRLLDAWRAGAFEVVACPALLAELATVLARPKFAGIPAADRASVLREIEIDAWMAPDPVDVPRRSRDPKDDYLLALADEQSVDALISGDRDLLGVESTPVPVRSARAFLDVLDEGP